MLSFVETAQVVSHFDATRRGDRIARCQFGPVAISVVFASRFPPGLRPRRCMNTTLVPFKCQSNTIFSEKLYHDGTNGIMNILLLFYQSVVYLIRQRILILVL